MTAPDRTDASDARGFTRHEIEAALRNLAPADQLQTLRAWHAAGLVAPALLPVAIRWVWQPSWSAGDRDPAERVALLRTTGFLCDWPGIEAPTSPLTVYRGCTLNGVRGIYWSTSLAVASAYAERSLVMGRGAIVIATATVGPDDVLAIFNHHDAPEVVVDPSGLRDLAIEPKTLADLTELDAVAMQWVAPYLLRREMGLDGPVALDLVAGPVPTV